jgi:glycosyltransferase involved in cell wall biosynthesis
MRKTLISIIIPTYNSENVIADCIESIMLQSYPFKEIIVVDGVSDDSTTAVVRDFSCKHSSIVLISERDKGIYDAMNKGISRASGEWLYFMGSDDRLFDENVLQRVADEIDLNTCEMIYGILGGEWSYL